MQLDRPAFLLGLATGMRSMTGLAALCWAGKQGLARSGWAPRTEQAFSASLVMAAGEMAGDKMPFAPDRRIIGSVLVRAAIGAVGGAALGSRADEGAIAGMLGALAATLLGRTYRGAHTRTRSDWFRAMTEDAAAAATAYAAIKQVSAPRRA